MHVASTDHEPGHGNYEAGLRDLRGHDLIWAIWGIKKKQKKNIFPGKDRTSKLFSDLNLGGPDDLRSDVIRGHLVKFSQFGEIEGYVCLSHKCC